VPPKKILIALAACILVAIAVVAFWPGEKEPECNGKKLSEWIKIRNGPDKHEAIKAIHAIGTNALPYLLKRIRRDVPVWQRKAAEQCKRAGFDWPQRFVSKRIRQQANAWEALGDLGLQAHSAIPQVHRLALESASNGTAWAAINFLRQSAPAGIPPLLEIIEQSKIDRRRWAVALLGQTRDLGINGPSAVDTLLKCLQQEDQIIAENAVLSLHRMALENKKVIPILTERLRDTHGMVRYCASRALASLGNSVIIPELRDAVPELVNVQNDPYPLVRQWATNALLKIAPEALTNGMKEF
jgi:HEAT repeat protein